jgi:SAM-dependent methyltransferase
MPTPDVLKSWDVWHALTAIEQAGIEHTGPVLDMGCYNSEILYVLNALGYRQLYGCDLNPLCRRLPYWHRVHYRAGDLTRTPYRDGFFAAITCLSVIEHGVPLQALVREVARLLRPGGIFILTTDYDVCGRHLVSHDLKPFGLDWMIHTPAELLDVLTEFASFGLTLLDPGTTEWAHAERPINWNGHSYTFALAVLRAPVR